MTVLQRVIPAGIVVRSVAHSRRPFVRTFHYDSTAIASTRTRCFGIRSNALPTSSMQTRCYSKSKPSKPSKQSKPPKTLNRASVPTPAVRPEDKVMKDTDFDEGSEETEVAAADEVVVSGEESEQLKAVNSALEQMMEQEDVVDTVEEATLQEVPQKAAPVMAVKEPEAIVSLDMRRTVLQNFYRYSKRFFDERKQHVYIIFSKNMNSLAFAKAESNIHARLREYHEKKLIPECIGVELLPPGLFAHSAVKLLFRAWDYIPPAPKYPSFWGSFWGEGNILDIRCTDDYQDWVGGSVAVNVLPSEVRGEKLQELLRKENPGIFDDPLGRPEKGHPFASFFSTGSGRYKLRVKIPPASYWKVFADDGLMLLGKRWPLGVNSAASLEYEYTIARVWYSSPSSIGRNNRYLEYNYTHQLAILEALKTMKNPNDREQRRQMIETIKATMPPPPPPELPEAPKQKQKANKQSRAKSKVAQKTNSTPAAKKGYIKATRVGGRLVVQFVPYEEVSKTASPAKKEMILPYQPPKPLVMEGLVLKHALGGFAQPQKLQPITPIGDYVPRRRLRPVDEDVVL
ncbi:hypothetical protein BJ508DRAFT_416415 [Ascobolus immersus RN42]|uniref:Uncharacterized protein n=1 Tax=Ascobolus immersus RN42 TaxID=1160509 RepID=A0A3N4I3J9_ASCIM|nr:hypothetical protein BJ508DRAFT_416415 [Ascobolus immersus RN42]